jgi:hypothetical protein
MKATHNPPTLDDDPTMTPAALLRGAALYLQRHGWTQGQFFELLADTDGPLPPACTSGAINICVIGRPALAADVSDTDPDESAAAITAMRVFAAYLDPDYTFHDLTCLGPSAIDVIGDWNDDKGRTLDDVVQALNEAANDWETAHPTGGAR